MTYTFTNLYYPDFEDLARDLLGKKRRGRMAELMAGMRKRGVKPSSRPSTFRDRDLAP